jgi:hypothetical protein
MHQIWENRAHLVRDGRPVLQRLCASLRVWFASTCPSLDRSALFRRAAQAQTQRMVVTMSRTPLPTATWEWQGLFVSSCAARNYQRTTGSQQGTNAASSTDRNPQAAWLEPNKKLPLLAVGEMYARSHGSTDCKLPPELNMYTARLPAGIEWRECPSAQGATWSTFEHPFAHGLASSVPLR